MTFHPEKVDEFVEVFKIAKPRIEAFSGCEKVQMMRDLDQRNICFTFSYWDSKESLEEYRKSDLFTSTWEKAKQLFSDRPEAWSMDQML